jgi:thioesterase domain-containing protein/acyl carrier protein
LGRIDHQVKIRGFRIELGEIEAVLNQHPKVRESVVVATTHASGEKRLAAYLVLSGAPLSLDELRQHLAATLPEYMIPAAFMVLESLPLSPSGKVDRRALPAPEFATSAKLASPRDVLEQRLVAMWERILAVRPVGVRDNFFSLGGHSLTALRLMTEVEKEFSIRLPVAALFQSPTIESLAPLLRNQTAPLSSPAIQLQKGDGRAPFFFVPGGGGNMVYLTELARLLGSEQTLYGMRYRGLDGEAPADTNVEVIAGRMVEAIKTVQRSGPYRVGGHCFGGLIAFEIARKLEREGQRVQLLALFNTPAPAAVPSCPTSVDPGQARWIETIARAWEEVTGACVAIKACDLDGLDEEAQLQMLRRAMVSADLLPAEADINYIRGLVSVFRANSMARYCPDKPLAVPITLFRASEFHPHFDFTAAEDKDVPAAQSTLGWRRFSANPVTVHPVPGNHLTMLTMPHIETMARVLQKCLAHSEHRYSAEVM